MLLELPVEYGYTVVYDRDVITDRVPVGPDVEVILTKVPMAELEPELVFTEEESVVGL